SVQSPESKCWLCERRDSDITTDFEGVRPKKACYRCLNRGTAVVSNLPTSTFEFRTIQHHFPNIARPPAAFASVFEVHITLDALPNYSLYHVKNFGHRDRIARSYIEHFTFVFT